MIKAVNKIPGLFFKYLKKVNLFALSEGRQLQLAADLVPFGIWEYDLVSGYIEWSKPLYKLLGIERKAFDNTLSGFKNMIHPDDREQIENIIKEVMLLSNDDLKKYMYRITPPDQSTRFIQGNIRLIKDKKNRPVKLTGVCVDITQQKLVECELKNENKKTDLYLASVEAMIVVLNNNASIRLMNKAGCKITGYTEKEVVNQDWFDLFSPVEKRSRFKNAFAKISTGLRTYPEYYEREIITKSGGVKCIAWRNTLLKDDDNNITGILATGTDITEKKIAERKLLEQNERLREIAWMQSHEVRKPLANIIGLLTLVDQKKMDTGNETIFQFLKQSTDELDHMIRSIIEKTKAVDA